MEVLFWVSAAFLAYVYAGYPAVVGVWAAVAGRLKPRNGGVRLQAEDFRLKPEATPVSVVIAARNEAARLPARIQNLLESSYPAPLQIVVASDGSTDGTREALASFGSRVELIELPPSGKGTALNAAVARARHPIVVFADARQRFAPDAIARLVERFADPSVGAVSGELHIDVAGSTIGDGVGAYWTYETWLRRREARIGSTLGVTGAIYAMRRHLWTPLPAGTLLDDVLAPMRVVLGGHRVTFEPAARAFDAAAADAPSELRRKVRTLAGNFQLLAQEPRLLVPGLNPVWVQFMSHKVGRLFAPYALVALLVSSAALAPGSLGYAAAFCGQAAFYALALYGARLDRRERPAPARGEAFREAA
jgi:cellulose synthase/poly-beta-1,6-N-acetylglucosamine synthase-like glycosyltransferase